MIDWSEVRSAILERRSIAALPSRHKALRRGIMERWERERWGNGKAVSIRIAELYAALKGHEKWLHGRESHNDHTSEKYEEIRRIVESMSLHDPKTVIHAAIEIERNHCPCPVSFRQTFERLMHEGRREARAGYMSQGFAYCFMRAYDAL